MAGGEREGEKTIVFREYRHSTKFWNLHSLHLHSLSLDIFWNRYLYHHHGIKEASETRTFLGHAETAARNGRRLGPRSVCISQSLYFPCQLDVVPKLQWALHILNHNKKNKTGKINSLALAEAMEINPTLDWKQIQLHNHFSESE